MEVPSYAKQEVTDYLRQKAEEVYEEFKSTNGIDKHNWANQTEPVQLFVVEQAPSCAEEMVQEYKDADIDFNQENCQELTRQYIDENYDSGFIYDQLDHKYNFDKAFEDAKDELGSWLENTEPYGNYPLEYFLRKADSIKSLKEFLNYCDTDGVHVFVEKYAPYYADEASDRN